MALMVSACLAISCQGPRQEKQEGSRQIETAMPEEEVLHFLDSLFVEGQEHEMFNMPSGDGSFLRFLVTSTERRRALEIGTSNGLSAIWIGLGLKETGGHLTTIEIDHEKVIEARRNIRRVGLEQVIEVVEADAFKAIPELEGTFDFVHLDAWKEDYKRFLDLFYPKVEEGGVFAAHNAILMGNYMQDYLDSVRKNPALLTIMAQTSNDGFAVSYRRSSSPAGTP
jgi:predicted O-methyltransferase YrrM